MNGDWLALARQHAPALIVTLPMLGAVLAALSPSGRAAWAAASVCAVAALIIAGDLWLGVYRAGALVYALGGWSAPVGSELRVDPLGAFGAVIVLALGAGAIVCGHGVAAAGLDRPRRPLAAALSSAVLTGFTGAIVAGDLFSVFAFVQLAWIAAAALVALGGEADRRAFPAAFRVLTIGSIAALLWGFGAAALFAATGETDIARIAAALAGAETGRAAAAGLALTLAAAAIVAALAPLNLWAPAGLGRGEGAGPLVLAGAPIVAGLILLARMMGVALGGHAGGLLNGAATALGVLGAVSVLIGSAQAAAASDLRRLTAYALAAQAGCAALGLSLGSPDGMSGALFHLLNLSAIGFLLIGAAAALPRAASGGAPLSALDGLARRAPLLSAAIGAAVLSLMGAPLTAGFLSKWLLIQAALEQQAWGATAALIASSLAAIYYGGRLLERLYFRSAVEGAPPRRGAALWLAPGLAAAGCAAIGFGLNAALPLEAAHAATAGLTWSGP